MKIILADHYGTCFGVRDAIALAERLAKTSSLTILGELVHNPIVRERLAKAGARESALELIEEGAQQVLITAHGASDGAKARWKEAGASVADGTCPLVRHAHAQLRLLVQQGFTPVVVGKRSHAEVAGLTGDFPGSLVVESIDDVVALPLRERYGVISQTTQQIVIVRQIIDALRATFPEAEVRFVDTVCQPTKNRQIALKKLLDTVDALVVVGGRSSNNTLQLVRTGEEAGLRVCHVERPAELSAHWFRKVGTLGVTAGTSTLKETVAEVVVRLEEIAAQLAADATF